MIEIKRIIEKTDADIESINRLLSQQSPSNKKREISKDDLMQALSNPLFHLLVISDSEKPDYYIGMATIFFQRNLARWIGEIHDVVVDEQARGRGLGEKLVKELMGTARNFCSEQRVEMKLYLTSRPSRIPANSLYTKLGFTLVARSEGLWGYQSLQNYCYANRI